MNVDANADDSNADDSRVPRDGALLEDASALFAGATAAGAWELADAIATFLLAAAAAGRPRSTDATRSSASRATEG